MGKNNKTNHLFQSFSSLLSDCRIDGGGTSIKGAGSLGKMQLGHIFIGHL